MATDPKGPEKLSQPGKRKITTTKAGTWFPQFHTHDDHSVKDGAATVESYADIVVATGGTALAITNHGQASGFARQYFACKERGLKPIFGMEAYINERRLEPWRQLVAELKEKKDPSLNDKIARAAGILKAEFRPGRHAIILARNLAGYRNLVRMSTDSWRRGFYYVPRTDTKFLADHAEGLIFSTACIGGYLPKLAAQDMGAAVREARRLMKVFGPGGFYVELMCQGWSGQRETNVRMMNLARMVDAPTIITCDVHYAKPSDQPAQAALLLMRDKKTLADTKAGGALTSDGAWEMESTALHWRTLESVNACWQEHHQEIPRDVFVRSIKNTYALAESIEDITFDTSLKLPGIFENPDQLLRDLTLKGWNDLKAKSIVPSPGRTQREYAERIQRELSVVRGKGFSEYFLVLHDICSHARSIGARMGPGRGSAGGSLVAFLLGITYIDPLRFNLLFERFLDASRKDAPDIDLDFSPKHRESIKAYIEKTYPSTATVGTFATFKPRATLQQVAAVYGIERKEMQAITKPMGTDADKVGKENQLTWDDMLELWPQLGEWAKAHPDAWSVVSTLNGLNSHRGTHASAILIGPKSAFDDVPLMLGPGNDPTAPMVTAFPDTSTDGTTHDGRELSRLGYLKLDILGVANVDIAPDAVEILRRDEGIDVDLSTLPLDDEETLAHAARADVPGTFQFDTPTTRPILLKVKPDSFFDLAIVTSLARPGPLENGLDDKFAAMKRKGDRWKQTVPEVLHDVLAPSRGLMVFQEDVMFTLQRMGGMSMQESNAVRKAIGKKLTAEKLEEYRAGFVDGGVKLGHTREALNTLFDTLAAYCKYAFNASHAVAYALTAYRQMYMLAHHPLSYFAALLAGTDRGKKKGPSKVADNDEVLVGYMRAAMAKGCPVLMPDVNRSGLDFDTSFVEEKQGAILYGLGKIKGVASAAEAILQARPFASVEEMYQKVDRQRVHARVFQTLILAGALDGLGTRWQPAGWDEQMADCEPIERRNLLLAAYTRAVAVEKENARKRKRIAPDLPDSLPGYTPLVLKEKERELLGLTLSWWSSQEKDDIRGEVGGHRIADALEAGVERFTVLAEVARSRTHKTARGTMAFVTLADESGALDNMILWSEQWRAYGTKFKRGRVLVVQLQRRESNNRQYGRWSYYLNERARGEVVQTAERVMRSRG